MNIEEMIRRYHTASPTVLVVHYINHFYHTAAPLVLVALSAVGATVW